MPPPDFTALADAFLVRLAPARLTTTTAVRLVYRYVDDAGRPLLPYTPDISPAAFWGGPLPAEAKQRRVLASCIDGFVRRRPLVLAPETLARLTAIELEITDG